MHDNDDFYSKLKEKDRMVFEVLRENLLSGYPPSVREICVATGIKSTSTVHACLKALEQAGLIYRDSGLNRAIRLTQDSPVRVPVLGDVQAGKPLLAVENIESFITCSVGRSSADDLFALRVRGESMIDVGIFEDDILIVDRSLSVNNGDIAVILIGDEATVKTFYKEKGHFRLQPENDDFEPIIVDECDVLGRVTSLIREF